MREWRVGFHHALSAILQSSNLGNKLGAGKKLDAGINKDFEMSINGSLNTNGSCDIGLSKRTQVDGQLRDADGQRGLNLGLDVGLDLDNKGFDILLGKCVKTMEIVSHC